MDTDTADLSLSREALVGFGAKLVLGALGFVGIILFYRLLGQAVVGRYYTILAGVLLGGQIANGITNAVRKRVSEVQTSVPDYLAVGVLVWTSQIPFVVVGALVFFEFTPLLTPLELILVAGMLLSETLFALINRVYAATGHPASATWADAGRSLLTFGSQIGLILTGFGIVGLMSGYLAATFASALGVWFKLSVIPSVPSREQLERVYEFARWSVLSTFTDDLYRRLDVLIISILVGSTAVGLYEPALRLTVPATFVAMSVGRSLTIKASGLSSLGRDVLEDTKNAVSYTGILAIPLFFGALSIAEPLMRTVYGASAVAGAPALVGLTLFQVFNVFGIPFENVVDGIDRPELRLYISASAVVINVPAALLLGWQYGLEGVVLATILSEFVRLVAYELLAYRLFGSVVLTRPVVEQVVSGLVMYAVVEMLLATGFSVQSWVWLAVIIATGGAAYFGTLALISSHFKRTVRNALNQLTMEV